MPPKRSSIGSLTPQARKKKALRASETHVQRETRLEKDRVRVAKARSSETVDQREARLETVRVRIAKARSYETVEQRKARIETVRVHTAQARLVEGPVKGSATVAQTVDAENRESTESKTSSEAVAVVSEAPKSSTVEEARDLLKKNLQKFTWKPKPRKKLST